MTVRFSRIDRSCHGIGKVPRRRGIPQQPPRAAFCCCYASSRGKDHDLSGISQFTGKKPPYESFPQRSGATWHQEPSTVNIVLRHSGFPLIGCGVPIPFVRSFRPTRLHVAGLPAPSCTIETSITDESCLSPRKVGDHIAQREGGQPGKHGSGMSLCGPGPAFPVTSQSVRAPSAGLCQSLRSDGQTAWTRHLAEQFRPPIQIFSV